jgi:hypothetical protein
MIFSGCFPRSFGSINQQKKGNLMSDDPKKKHIDGWFVNLSERYEYQYFVTDIRKTVVNRTTEEIKEATYQCALTIKPSEGRKKLEACVLKRLGH